jgi:diguanylate cyclase (GGDEF)-like protein/PAS domain S-box-containing protein
MNATIWLPMTAAIAGLLIAYSIYTKDKKNPLHQLAAAYALSVAFLNLFNFLFLQAPDPSGATLWLHSLALIFVTCAIYLHFVLYWTQSKYLKRQKFLVWLLYSISLGFMIFTPFFNLLGTPFPLDNGLWGISGGENYTASMTTMTWLGLLIAVTILIAIDYYFKLNPVDKKKQRFILLGVTLPFLVIFLMASATFLKIQVTPIYAFFIFLGNVAIAYGIKEYQNFTLNSPTAYHEIINSINEGLVLTSPEGIIQLCNPAFCSLTGYHKKELIGKDVAIVFPSDEGLDQTCREKILNGEKIKSLERIQVSKEGNEIPILLSASALHDKSRNIIGIVFVTTDISSRKETEATLEILATTDSLTGMYNRRHLYVLAEREIGRAIRYRHPLSAIMLDIDDFKTINDTYGHAMGDQVLRLFSAVCKANFRTSDILGRYGGDEFVILLPETDLDHAALTAERLRVLIENTTANGDYVAITISMGVAEIHQMVDPNVDKLLDYADQALYDAKQAGRNCVATWKSRS